MKDYFKRKLGDRYDGWRVSGIDPILKMMPYLQRTRFDGLCYFDDPVDVTFLEEFIRSHKEELPGLSIMHVVIAAMVRAISQRPYTNRFIVHNKLYAHNDIRIALMVKRSMSDKGEETAIMPIFNPFDTLKDVVAKINTEVEKNKGEVDANDFDIIAKLLGALPHFLIRLLVSFMRFSDNHRFLPKFMHEVSPYHSSAFITNVGSLGIGPIYHHLYEFGTCSLFVALGKKAKHIEIDHNGNATTVRTIGLKYTVDERICDGHYNSVTIRYMRKLIKNPTELLTPPEKVVIDDGIKRPLWHDPNA